ncbi:hypothetical protein FIBSPDRAFT_895154 [Athelia psychrophila]|uniref:Uncharacterized protein n=1 Tax=Athelia psychrophila TaxID=1759441 RepID=A0A166EZ52_9AGAM|nr:hypothetical protein FIBSPDRAFT_895154 [Fibularhizoctonia sp. CBS 109695]
MSGHCRASPLDLGGCHVAGSCGRLITDVSPNNLACQTIPQHLFSMLPASAVFNTTHAGGNAQITNVSGDFHVVHNVYPMTPDQGLEPGCAEILDYFKLSLSQTNSNWLKCGDESAHCTRPTFYLRVRYVTEATSCYVRPQAAPPASLLDTFPLLSDSLLVAKEYCAVSAG